jgi:L-arabinokinase
LGKQETRSRLGLPIQALVVLFSFGGIGLDLTIHSDSRSELVLISTDPSPHPGAPFIHLSDAQLAALNLRYCDLVAAADVVVSKLGYGIVSECIANQTALLYLPRGNFREHPILEAGVRRYVPACEIQLEDLLSKRWQDRIFELLGQPFPPPPDCRGADSIAEALQSLATL